ncbi:MAG: UDP-N-acetylmuramate--L-alanine ligase, partial [Candidatus Aminicenantes bacterium]|nr:UDP-N-acetylmuramate--L-alanine ligase [Candidatus Aminicenantes bacterium]
GFSAGADVRAVDVKTSGFASSYRLLVQGQDLGPLRLSVGGRHNVANSLAAVSAALEVGVSLETIRASLENFSLPERRFQVLLAGPSLLVIDDYAHHPSEIKATLKTLRSSSCRRVIAVFQPHRFTRLQILMKRFATAFRAADILIITKLYSANQREIPGINSPVLADHIRSQGQENVFYLDSFPEISEFLRQQLRDGDGLVFLSAGNLTQLAHDFAAEMEAQKK